MLISLVSCQTVTTPFPIEAPSITAASQPTVTFKAIKIPTATPLPTSTLMPPCGTAALPHTAIPSVDASRTFTKFEPPENQIYFGFSFRFWDEISLNARWGDLRPFRERICDSVEFELSGKTTPAF
jgi:hypothetical protein